MTQARSDLRNIDQMVAGLLIAKEAGKRLGIDAVQESSLQQVSQISRTLRIATQIEGCIYTAIAQKCADHLKVNADNETILNLASIIESVLMKGE